MLLTVCNEVCFQFVDGSNDICFGKLVVLGMRLKSYCPASAQYRRTKHRATPSVTYKYCIVWWAIHIYIFVIVDLVLLVWMKDTRHGLGAEVATAESFHNRHVVAHLLPILSLASII
jgi:hypothetical protein